MAFSFKTLFQKQAKAQASTRVAVRDFLDNPTDASLPGVEYFLQQMAFWTIVRKIGAAIGAIEWETYRRGDKVKAKEYWSWNYEPNPNQTKEEFFQALVGALYKNGEALVVEVGDYRYVADSFGTEKSLSGDIYTDVVVRGQSLNRTYLAKDVLHFTLSGIGMTAVLQAVSTSEGKLIKSASSSYIRNQGTRGVLHIDDLAEADADFDETYEDLINDKFKKYFTAENAVLPLFKGYDFSMQESTGGSTKASLSGTRDIRSMYDDIVELTAQTFGVPLSIVTGKNVTKEDFSQFLTSVVKPVAEMIAQEINRKVYGQRLTFQGTHIGANYGNVKHLDIFEIADPIDKLIGSGALTINDIRKRLGLDPIDAEWADEHWMTKNYSPAEELLTGVENTEGKEEGSDE